MFWKKLWQCLKSLWGKIVNRKTSGKPNTILDTASVKVFGMKIDVTREVPVDVPYELTVVVPRAELRRNKAGGSLEVILSSVTIAHSPRFQRAPEETAPVASKPAA
ncbi:MAG: hypothetical protein ACM3X9_07995 [Bacillota bacterium]